MNSPIGGGERSPFAGLTDDQLKELKEIFDLFDQNQDGVVTYSELVSIFANMGQEPSESELKDLLKLIEKDDSSTLDFKDFGNLMTIRMTPEDTELQIKRAFGEFDKNRDGYINAEELKAVMKSIGESLTDEEVIAMIDYGSTNKDGQMDFDAFYSIITRPK